MNKKHKKKILLKLLTAVKKVEIVPEEHDGDVKKAAANRTATCINILHPYADLFDDTFRKKVLTFMMIGRAAEEGDTASFTKLEPMIEPIYALILETLEKMIRKLG